jgi:hypothetical protein
VAALAASRLRRFCSAFEVSITNDFTIVSAMFKIGYI